MSSSAGGPPSSAGPHETEGPVTVTGRYRRRPGGWLIPAALLIPLLLALVGLYLGGSRDSARSQARPAPTATSTPTPVGSPIVVTTADGRRTVEATVRDDASKRALLDGVRAGSDGLRVVDKVSVDENADAPAVAGIGTILAAGRGITDLGVVVDRASLSLSGQAPDQGSVTEAVFAAGQSYPGVQLVDRLSMPGGRPAAGGPLSPECEQVRLEVAGELKATPIKFSVGGAKVDPSSVQQLTPIAEKLGRCPFSQIEVAGHTDNTGTEAVNVPLSQRRADVVKTLLVQAGLSGDVVTSKGYGSAQPVADNSTPEGRAINRRVDINAS
ncbi:OmpA family protein [Mobilicoccus sp.]|uniref:channel-forming protein ArfA/OmpATb n=1 Tax=Mobilicoccus sp. TaxID=2034349 RepID=UPI0028978139|nr:OmpA family protein [Mobilicoccus sp.]